MSQENDSQIPPDPIYAKSLSGPIFFAMLAVVAAVALAIVDELWLRRPYKPIQVEFRQTYVDYLEGLQGKRRDFVDNMLMQLDEYEALTGTLKEVQERTGGDLKELNRTIANMDSKLRALTEAIKSPRSEIAAANYLAEHAAQVEGHVAVKDSDGAQEFLEKIERIRARELTYEWMETKANGEPDPKSETEKAGKLIADMAKLQEAKGAKQGELAVAARELSDARKEQAKWLKDNMGNIAILLKKADDDVVEAVGQKVAEVGADQYLAAYVTELDATQIGGLIDDANRRLPGSNLEAAIIGGDLRQIHIAESNNWVDRCETCHLGIVAPLPLRAEDMGGNALFASHPKKELLDTHDPERFGCSMCHGGNGVAITDTKLAHGLNKYWLHPLHPETNREAGCLQCHENDVVLPMGERITQGRENVRHYGCWGCHEMQAYDEEPVLERDAQKRVDDIDEFILEKRMRITNLQKLLNAVTDEDRFTELEPDNKRQRDALAQEIATLQTEQGALRQRVKDLRQEAKKVGPNLKEIRAKLKPEWLTQWIMDPTDWRPDTKMPVFRWQGEEEAKDVAAFLWQSAIDPANADYGMKRPPMGDPTSGEKIFDEVGCLACHSMGQGDQRVGSEFAANLSNLGEKSNYAYVVRWVTNPRHRLAPYCPECDRDLTPADYEKAGREFVFDKDHAFCPNCDQGLKWMNPVVMPSFRLSDKEAQDVAAYLVAQKGSGVTFEQATWLEDEERFARGKRLVQHHGCAGCHEIGGLEKEGRIGTQLKDWGSKPLERLDFGHYTLQAKRGIDPLRDWVAPKDGKQIFDEDGKWYRHRGFAMHKLAEPDIYDTSKNVGRFEALRMPKFNLSGQEIHDIVTVLLGSVEDTLPESATYQPDEDGQAIQEGWKLVRRYNCQGCHQINPGEVPAIQDVPGFEEKDWPPSLVGTGFRTQPDWLARFLHDPSLGGGTAEPKSGRPYLSTRMPSFQFTEGEVGRLVRFFDAMAKQPTVYQKPPYVPLTREEQVVAEIIFKDANCAQCHVVEGQPFTTETKAPKLDLARERLRPEWVARWIQDPALLSPGTSMPALFKQEESGRWYYGNENIERVTNYKGDHVDLMVRYLISLSD